MDCPQQTHIFYSVTQSGWGYQIKQRFVTHNDLLSLVTSNFYSILYYNSEIWQINTLKSNLKQNLLSASAKALRVCLKLYYNCISFNELHNLCKRASPEQFMFYKMALCLFKLYNRDRFKPHWIRAPQWKSNFNGPPN